MAVWITILRFMGDLPEPKFHTSISDIKASNSVSNSQSSDDTAIAFYLCRCEFTLTLTSLHIYLSLMFWI